MPFQRSRAIIVTVAILGLIAGAWAGPVAAAPATPPPDSDTPAIEDCQIDPPSPDEFAAVIVAPAGPTETPGGALPASGNQLTVTSEADFPTGKPADAATTKEVEAVVREFLACNNGGDLLRLAALVTGDLLRGLVGATDVTEAEAAQVAALVAAPPTPRPVELRTAIIDMRDARIFDDGRAGLILVSDVPGDEEAPATSLVILVKADEGWRGDAVITVDPDAAP